jgi:predicted CXXCH cytochrome family protein
LLVSGSYHPDGQVEGEVYEYGAFVQSRMEHEGVTCSDCHDPHRLALRAEGNALCLRCHDARYDATAHHHHAPGSAAARCVTCHMPSHTFMVIQERHDHGLRVPRPDVSGSLGTPNVCAGCHAGQSARWAVERMRAWYGHDPSSFQRFAGALGAARHGDADAAPLLAALVDDPEQPAIARGSAAAALGGRGDEARLAALRRALWDADPLVRVGGVLAAGNLPPERRWDLLAPIVRDSLRVLRALAGGALAGLPLDRVPADSRPHLERAKADYVEGEMENSDQPFGRVNLGSFLRAEGDAAGAEREFRAALTIDPDWIPASVDLADLLRAASRDSEGEAVLEAALARHPESAALHHALGLLRVRQKRHDAALEELARAVALAPDEPRFAYVYAVGLADAGRVREALAVVERGLARRPDDPALSDLAAQLRGSTSGRP